MPAATVVPTRTVPSYAAEALAVVGTHVFTSMVGQPLVAIGPTDAVAHGRAEIVGTVAFTGSWTGYVGVVTSRGAATAITGALLGPDAEDLEAQVRDAIGEVVNMLAGGLRTRLSKPGNTWTVAMPMVATGDNVTIAPPREAGQVVQRFLFGSHVLELHLVVTSMAEFGR